MTSPIAIVGMSCVYPEARSPAELWQNVLAQRRAFRRLPSERLRAEDYLSPDPHAPDKTYAAEAAVIEGYEFDRVAFRVVGSTYRSADLAHWLALDVASRALADAGFAHGDGLDRGTTGVVLGNTLTGEFSRANLMRLRWPYVRRTMDAALADEGWDAAKRASFLDELEGTYKQPFPPVGEETLAGGLSNTIAGRICNQFDFKGGGYTVDGACASSLLAVANACSSLAAGDLDVALAGGVDLSLDPFEIVGFAKTGALAPELMRIYDTRSAGFWPGEGCGFVVLMRHADAIAKGCRIYATIRGWGISSDGAGGITRPEVDGQLQAIRRAYRRAGYGPDTVEYFEGHGTGTAVGDATELQVISRARREANTDAPPAAIGSVKANIGHTKAAAGVAGLLKAIMAVHEQILPPTTGCENPSAELQGDKPALRVLREPESWPAQHPLRASVSAMGFGGMNAHVTLEGVSSARRSQMSSSEQSAGASAQDAELFLFAAADETSLRSQVERVLAFAPRLSRSELSDLAHELSCHLVAADVRRLTSNDEEIRASSRRLLPRENHPVRAAVVASSPAELAERHRAHLPLPLQGGEGRGEGASRDHSPGVYLSTTATPPRIGFLFPGQASPANLSGGAHRRRFACVRELYASANLPTHGDRIATDIAQPAIVTASLAGLRILNAFGIEGSVAVGHSLGELTALHWAGAYDEAALLRIVRARGKAMAELGSPTGAMAAIAARSEEVQPLLDHHASIVGYNSPCQTVIAGEAGAVAAVVARAQARGLRAVKLAVSHAFHTPLVAAAAPELARRLSEEAFGAMQGPVVSSVTGSRLSPSENLRDLLTRQVTSPVRFSEALAAASAEVDCWIEVGPGHVLSGLATDCGAKPAFVLDAGGASLKPLLQTLGALFALGAPVDASALFAGRFTRAFNLDWKPRFFVNPCELAPVPEVSSLAPSDGERAGVRGNAPRHAHGKPLTPTLSSSEGEREKSRSPLDLVRHLVAERAELPAAAIKDDSRLLGDLHLNSISVGQLVADAARRLGLAPIVGLNEFANATVRGIAQALEELLRVGSPMTAADKVPAGVDSWVRSFTLEWIEKPLPSRTAAAGRGTWEVLAPAGHPLAAALDEKLPGIAGGGVVVCLGSAPNEAQIPLLLAGAKRVLAARKDGRLIVVQHGWGGGGFARTLFQEAQGATVCVVNVPPDHPQAVDWICAEAGVAHGFVEAAYDGEGVRREPRLRLLDVGETAQDFALGTDDVLLVTGGGKGIAAECALALARRTGVKLALLGRAQPERDAELAANLERFTAAGAQWRYYTADVADTAAVKSAVEQAGRELGKVTAVLHGAGTNVPQLLSHLDEAAFQRTLAPKVQGLRNILSAVDSEALRLCVTFGSIIARAGLVGEADYALANEWQTAALEEFQAAHPHCRCLALEWSVWSGVGMGERLGRVESLLQQGITPIPPDVGVEMLCELVLSPERRVPSRRVSSGEEIRAEKELGAPPVAVVIAGRFGEPPTLLVEKPELPFLRFLEKPRAFYPGIELIADATLSAANDPYLEDHVYHGERLFPAVLGLEAMAQAAMAVSGIAAPPCFENVSLDRPIVVPREGELTIRIAALVRGPGLVEVVVRSAETGFAADHFKALCRFRPDTLTELERVAKDAVPGFAAAPLPLEMGAEVYDELLFHTGRFRRVAGYRHLRAKECLAEIEPDTAAQWFGRYLPGDLALGDAGARDAGIHCIQACIPHRRLLPIGVERIELGGAPCMKKMREAMQAGPTKFLLHARERRQEGDTFTYDLELLSCDGCVLERWTGLRLRAVEDLKRTTPWPAGLLSPWLERKTEELIPGAAVSVAVEETQVGRGVLTPPSDVLSDRGAVRTPRPTTSSDSAMQHAADSPWPVRRRSDGRPEMAGRNVSASHAGRLTLAVAGQGAVGCDIEPVAARTAAVWEDLLGADRFRLAGLISAEAHEDFDTAATRVWAAGECLKKAGAMVGASLVLDASKPDGWVVLSSGHWSIATCVPPVREGDGAKPMAVAVLAAAER